MQFNLYMNIRMKQNKKLRNRGNKSYYSFAKNPIRFLEQMGRHMSIKGQMVVLDLQLQYLIFQNKNMNL